MLKLTVIFLVNVNENNVSRMVYNWYTYIVGDGVLVISRLPRVISNTVNHILTTVTVNSGVRCYLETTSVLFVYYVLDALTQLIVY